MVTLSIIIVNWNTKRLVINCLESIYKNISEQSFEIWVVDNNSTDGSVSMINENFPMVNLITNRENIGFAKANNRAITAIHSKYILLLNPDTLLMSDPITNIIHSTPQ